MRLKEELFDLSLEAKEEEVEVSEEGDWLGVLDGWVIGKAGEEPTDNTISPSKDSNFNIERLNEADVSKLTNSMKTEEEDLDSDDDDLPAFDMSNDTPVTEETKVKLKTNGIRLTFTQIQRRFQSYTSEMSFTTSLTRNHLRCKFC